MRARGQGCYLLSATFACLAVAVLFANAKWEEKFGIAACLATAAFFSYLGGRACMKAASTREEKERVDGEWDDPQPADPP